MKCQRMKLRRAGAQSRDCTICDMTHRTNIFETRKMKGAVILEVCHVSNGEET